MVQPKQSLEEFAKANPGRRGAETWVEQNVPEDIQQEIVKGWKSGLRATTIVRWLEDEGFAGITGGKLASFISKSGLK